VGPGHFRKSGLPTEEERREREADMKRVFAALMLAAILAAWGGCSTAPYRDEGYGSPSGRPADAVQDKFEREKATSSATAF
jgi:hypothetical protein